MEGISEAVLATSFYTDKEPDPQRDQQICAQLHANSAIFLLQGFSCSVPYLIPATTY